jgi:hypothetical protein
VGSIPHFVLLKDGDVVGEFQGSDAQGLRDLVARPPASKVVSKVVGSWNPECHCLFSAVGDKVLTSQLLPFLDAGDLGRLSLASFRWFFVTKDAREATRDGRPPMNEAALMLSLSTVARALCQSRSTTITTTAQPQVEVDQQEISTPLEPSTVLAF